jgi:hypothetical protein
MCYHFPNLQVSLHITMSANQQSSSSLSSPSSNTSLLSSDFPPTFISNDHDPEIKAQARILALATSASAVGTKAHTPNPKVRSLLSSDEQKSKHLWCREREALTKDCDCSVDKLPSSLEVLSTSQNLNSELSIPANSTDHSTKRLPHLTIATNCGSPKVYVEFAVRDSGIGIPSDKVNISSHHLLSFRFHEYKSIEKSI